MPSKGIDCYAYISPNLTSKWEVRFSVPQDSTTFTSNDNFTSRHLEVESSKINGRDHLVSIHGIGHVVGRFQWSAYRDGIEVATNFSNINALTGNLAAGSGMLSTQHFTPIKTDDAIITYGFYDAGHGEAGLTCHDQCYVTIAPVSLASWMGELAPPGSVEETKPFSRLCLVAPHDNGMNTMVNVDLVVQSLDQGALGELKKHMPHLTFFDHVPDSVLIHLLPNIVYGVAVTQKKTITMMLELGARYFEFRPAYLLPLFQRDSHLENKLYFQHACIPGMAFDDFLDEQIAFLDTHPTEITVIHLRHDNIPKECKLPTDEEIHSLLTSACAKATNQPLSWGSSDLLQHPIASLRASSTRLIILHNAAKYDSWTPTAYATLSASPILAQFESMTTAGQLAPSSGDLTILQCQATSQSIREVLVYSVLASHAATSCLVSTKAALDCRTLPWLRGRVNERFWAPGRLVVVMNDFLEGGSTETGVEISRGRLAWE
ncbi:PLC-like phosphodiesterase [Teratosphaeria nubilosa]|uniref:PLC-like phosphodiesterase n=1 Tax=Teratosphaeria nubilosa TaxID=161662 RepID=A0A6G1LCP5_9PEZI|nr:PLC-like phosphodiesterase [Teratosphaeria nubilosa]